MEKNTQTHIMGTRKITHHPCHGILCKVYLNNKLQDESPYTLVNKRKVYFGLLADIAVFLLQPNI